MVSYGQPTASEQTERQNLLLSIPAAAVAAAASRIWSSGPAQEQTKQGGMLG